MLYRFLLLLATIALGSSGASACGESAKPRPASQRDASDSVDGDWPSPQDGGRAAEAGQEAGAPRDAGAAPPVFDAADWQRRVIYLAMPDRFVNGDPENDQAGQPECFDPSNPRKFHGGDLKGLRTHLDYLSELGVGALWTTPLYRQISAGGTAACGYHGYWADFRDPDDGAMEPKFGELAEAQALVEELHARDMKYIADLVVNHCSRSAALRNERPAWFHPSRPACKELGSEDVFCDLSGLPDFAQENPEVVAYLDALSQGWLERLGADGIRMDTVKHVSAQYFADAWIPRMRAQRQDVFLLGEHLTGSLQPYGPYLAAGFHSMFHFPLRNALVSALAKNGSLNEVASSVQDTISALGIAQARMLTTLLDNHDLPRFLDESAAIAPAEGWRRYRLALALLFTLPGIPQLYYGDELGMVGGENRRDMPPWAFDAAGRAAHHDEPGYTVPDESFAWVEQLSALRHARPALHAGTFAEMWRPGDSGVNVYAFLRASADDRLLVVVNASGEAAGPIALRVKESVSLDVSDKAVLLDGQQLTRVLGHAAPPALVVADGKITLELPARSVGIYALAP